jgi:hypothetical protein
MTLKLIDKDLRNKYAEALYKNEQSFDKDIEAQNKRLNLDLIRSSQMIDAGSQIFLNKVKQKRTKWSQDDLKFRDHYKLVCRNVQNKKIQNLKSLVASKNQNRNNNGRFFNSNSFDGDIISSFRNDETSENYLAIEDIPKSSIPKLPAIYNPYNNQVSRSDQELLYQRYSSTDLEFLDKFPAKIEITLTEIGKQYITAEMNRYRTLKKQKHNFEKIQDRALTDERFKDLVSYLDLKSKGPSK